MENKFRNEMTIEVGGEQILLRPDFDNCAALESNHGSLAWLGWKFSRGVRELKHMPGLTDIVLLIYYMQVATNPVDPTKKKFSKEELLEMVRETGIVKLVPKLIQFLGLATAGNKMQNEPTERQKKS